jgi:hypothetical protein
LRDIIAYLCEGRLLPPYTGVETGVGERLVASAIATAFAGQVKKSNAFSMVEYARERKAQLIVRGIHAVTDLPNCAAPSVWCQKP